MITGHLDVPYYNTELERLQYAVHYVASKTSDQLTLR